MFKGDMPARRGLEQLMFKRVTFKCNNFWLLAIAILLWSELLFCKSNLLFRIAILLVYPCK